MNFAGVFHTGEKLANYVIQSEYTVNCSLIDKLLLEATNSTYCGGLLSLACSTTMMYKIETSNITFL